MKQGVLVVRFGNPGAPGIKVGVLPGAGVDDNETEIEEVVALAATDVMLTNGTAVGLVERSETDGTGVDVDVDVRVEEVELDTWRARCLGTSYARIAAGSPPQKMIKVRNFILSQLSGIMGGRETGDKWAVFKSRTAGEQPQAKRA
jgi:hypothetical protein